MGKGFKFFLQITVMVTQDAYMQRKVEMSVVPRRKITQPIETSTTLGSSDGASCT